MKVVIIGAGIAGLSIGWRLQQAGCAVTILDRAQPAAGATWAAAGMLAVTAELEDAAEPERALALQAASLWPEFAAELEDVSGRALSLARSGTLILAEDAAALEVMRARGTVLDGAGCRARVPMLAESGLWTGGLWVADEAHVDNRAVGEALAIAFLKAGGTLNPNEAVVRIDRRGERAHAAHTPFGRYEADAFLVAAGAWSGLLEDIPVAPVKGEIIALAPPPDGARHPFQADGPVVWGHGIYCVPRHGRLLVGATMQDAGFDTGLTLQARDHLWSRASALMPALATWTLADQWAGLRPKSPDGLPLLGPLAPNLFVASGQYRNGILFAPAIAHRMAALMLGQESPDPAFDPRRFSS